MNTQFKKGIIELCVLSLIEERDMYGYELVKDISTHIDVSENTIYPILRRLTKEGNFTTYSQVGEGGKERKYYKITYEGQIHYKQMIKGWNEFLVDVDKILNRNQIVEERGEDFE